MDRTLSALGEILLLALPTFVLVVVLWIYLHKMFFGPLGKILEERRQATEGARQRGEEAFQEAERKTAQYEAALQAARAEIHREQQAERQKALEAQADRIREAREQAGAQLREAREQIAVEVASAQQSLSAQASLLADQILQAVLGKGGVA